MNRSISILGKVWKIKIRSRLKDDKKNECHGICDYAKRTILIDKKTLKSGPYMETVVHEIIHATLYEASIELNHVIDESIAGNVAKAIVGAFRLKFIV